MVVREAPPRNFSRGLCIMTAAPAMLSQVLLMMLVFVATELSLAADILHYGPARLYD